MHKRIIAIGIILWPLIFKGQSHLPTNERKTRYSLNYFVGLNRYYLKTIEDGAYEGPDVQLTHNLDFRFGDKYFFGIKLGSSATSFQLAKFQDSVSINADCELIKSKQYEVYDFGIITGYNREISNFSSINLAIGFDLGFFSLETGQAFEGLFRCDSLPFGGPDRRKSNSPFMARPRSLSFIFEYQYRLSHRLSLLARAEGIWRIQYDNFNFVDHSFRPTFSIGIGYTF